MLINLSKKKLEAVYAILKNSNARSINMDEARRNAIAAQKDIKRFLDKKPQKKLRLSKAVVKRKTSLKRKTSQRKRK